MRQECPCARAVAAHSITFFRFSGPTAIGCDIFFLRLRRYLVAIVRSEISWVSCRAGSQGSKRWYTQCLCS